MRVVRQSRRLLVTIGCVIALVAGAGCDWSQLGFDSAHTWFNSSEPALTTASVQHLGLAWFCGSCMDFWSRELVVSNGTVFAPGAGGLHQDDIVALDTATGATKWTQGTVPSTRAEAVGNGLVYCVNEFMGNPAVSALDQSTGASRWFTATPAPNLAYVQTRVAAVSGGLAFVIGDASSDPTGPFVGEVSAIDTTGHVVWSALPGGDVEDVAVAGANVTALWSEPSPGSINHLTTYDATDGHVVSSASLTLTDGNGHTLSPNRRLALGGGRAYLDATYRDSTQTISGLFAVDPTTGAVVWSAVPGPLGQYVLTPSRLVSVESLAGTHTLVARDPATGAVQWTGAPITSGSTLAVAGDVIYSDGVGISTYALADGSHLATFAPPAATESGLVPSEGHVYAFIHSGAKVGVLALRPTS